MPRIDRLPVVASVFLMAVAWGSSGDAAAAFSQANLQGNWTGSWTTPSTGFTAQLNFNVDSSGNITEAGGGSFGLGGTLTLSNAATGAVTGTLTFSDGAIVFVAQAGVALSVPGQDGKPYRLTGLFITNAFPGELGEDLLDASGGSAATGDPGGGGDTGSGGTVSPQPVPRNLPDVAIQELALNTAPAVAGRPVTVTATLSNFGDAAAGSFTVAFFRDRTQPGSSLDAAVLLSVPGIGIGSSVTVTAELTFPSPGDCSLAISVDPDGVLPEQIKRNNFLSRRVVILAQGIDLVIKLISVTESIPGVKVSLQAMVENRGLTAAPAGKLGVFANRPRSVSFGDQPDLILDLPALAGLSATLVSCYLPVQSAPRAGRAWLLADCNGTVAEELETNNVALATWGIANDPPLVTSPLQATPSTATANEPVALLLTAMDPNADELSFVWDFGDGNLSVGGSVASHTFAVEGRYTVEVSVSDGPYHEIRTRTVVEVAAPAIDLGTFSLRQTGGKLNIMLPVPTQFSPRERFRSKLILGTLSDKVSPRGQRLRGRLQRTGRFAFTLEYRSKKPAKVVRANYRYTVVE